MARILKLRDAEIGLLRGPHYWEGCLIHGCSLLDGSPVRVAMRGESALSVGHCEDGRGSLIRSDLEIANDVCLISDQGDNACSFW